WRWDGQLDFLGRIDHQVKIRGFRVELGEVESVLRQHPGIRDDVVDARVGATGGRRLVAYVVPAAPAAPEEDLRAFLGERLPDHMVPSAFVFLEALPLTPNGKVDRRALPEPEADRRGVEDNFFTLGGDSILSIQVTSRARRAGLQLTPRDLFEHPTIAGLAAVARRVGEVLAEPETVVGPVPLTPIQEWFFAQGFVAPHHFNLPLLLELRRPVAPAMLDRLLVRLLGRHDALRLRFISTEEGWRQEASPSENATPFTTLDLSALSASRQPAALEEAGAALQTSLDLSRGPLLRSALFELGAERRQRLLLAGHHLILDTVSWQILAEDLALALGQAGASEDVDLPPRTASFRRWAQRLAEHALSPAVAAELE